MMTHCVENALKRYIGKTLVAGDTKMATSLHTGLAIGLLHGD